MNKIYDCFLFFNELDLLEIRLRYLLDVVDYFVLVEGNTTFSGKNKPFYYLENKDQFAWAENKIIYVQTDLTKDLPTDDYWLKYSGCQYLHNTEFWHRVFKQRLATSEGLKNADYEDTIMISDVDEIPSKNGIKEALNIVKSSPCVLEQTNFRYFLNSAITDAQIGTVQPLTCLIKNSKDIDLQKIRDDRKYYTHIKNGGWHFSFLGSAQRVKTKMEACADIGANNLTLEEIQNNIDTHTLYSAKLQFRPLLEDDFPFPIWQNQEKYANLIWKP